MHKVFLANGQSESDSTLLKRRELQTLVRMPGPNVQKIMIKVVEMTD
jgi:hypothetical protein